MKACKLCKVEIDDKRGRTPAGNLFGPVEMTNLCAGCWTMHCSGCGVKIHDKPIFTEYVALKQKRILLVEPPTGRQHFCEKCWKEKKKEAAMLAEVVLCGQGIRSPTKNG